MTDGDEVPRVVSLFAGAGGFDVGLERAGWETVVATDIDTGCIKTLQAAQEHKITVRGWPNRFHLQSAVIKAADVRDLSGSDLKPPGAARDWQPDLLVGGPPCQPWSSAGLQKGFTDEQGDLIHHFIRLTAELRPRFVLFENVRGLVTAIGKTGRPGEVLRGIQRAFEDISFATSFATLNSADYGAAQRRVRLFMFASSEYELPAFPKKTHYRRGKDSTGPCSKNWIRLADFLAGLPSVSPDEVVRPSPKRAAELATLQPGTGIRTSGRIENNRPGGHWGYRQDSFIANPNLPSRTIRAATTPDWIRLPDGTHRRLTWSECAALQGFPSVWPFDGTVTSKFRQIGNAVQADVAEALGRVLLAALRPDNLAHRPESRPLPTELGERIRYTRAEHRTNGSHRIRVRASVL